MLDYLQGTTPTGMWCMVLMSVGGFLFGFDNGWWGTILGAEQFLRDYGSCTITDGVEKCSLSARQLSAGSGVQSAGIMVACLMAIYFNKVLGRRYTLVVTGIISIVGVVIEMTSAVGSRPRFYQFIAGKVIASMAMGLAANVVPIFLSETSTGPARGFGINMYQNVQIIGVIIASGTVFASSKRHDKACYLIPMGLQLLAPIIMVIMSPLLPESPRWLVWKGRLQEAEEMATRLFGSETNDFDAKEYVKQINDIVQEDRDNANAFNWLDLVQGATLRRLLIAVGIQCLQQAEGSSYMNNYIVSFLESTGVTDTFPYIMGLYAVYYVAILSGHVLPDRFGRRPLLMSTAALCGVCLIIVAIIVTVVKSPTEATQKGSIGLIFIWQCFFGIQSPLIWITTTEAAPSRNREKVQAVAVFCGFGVSLLIASVSPYLQNEGYGNLGGRIGFIWGSFSIITVAWVYFFVPEMKGLSIEQLDHLFDTFVPTRKFQTFVIEGEGEDLPRAEEIPTKKDPNVKVTAE